MRSKRVSAILLAGIIGLSFAACNNLTDLEKNTVTFNANGATSGKAPAERTVKAGTSITLPAGSGLNKTGYTFDGWNTKEDGTGTNYAAGASYIVTGNITLYAKWNSTEPGIIKYTITFNANGATSGTAPTAQTVNAGTSITLPAGSGLNKTECTFGGWNTNNNGTGTNYAAGASYTVTGNITLYAKWDSNVINTFTVTFNANGATSGTAPAARTVNDGTSITLPAGNGLGKTGYVFGGWNVNNTGTGTNYNAGASYPVTGNITLYVKWDTAPSGTITVTFSGFGDETIDLTRSAANDISRSQDQSLTVTVNGNFDDDTYAWYLDGYEYGWWSWGSPEIEIYAYYINIGPHTLTAVVTKDGVPYSKVLTFRVVY